MDSFLAPSSPKSSMILMQQERIQDLESSIARLEARVNNQEVQLQGQEDYIKFLKKYIGVLTGDVEKFQFGDNLCKEYRVQVWLGCKFHGITKEAFEGVVQDLKIIFCMYNLVFQTNETWEESGENDSIEFFLVRSDPVILYRFYYNTSSRVEISNSVTDILDKRNLGYETIIVTKIGGPGRLS